MEDNRFFKIDEKGLEFFDKAAAFKYRAQSLGAIVQNPVLVTEEDRTNFLEVCQSFSKDIISWMYEVNQYLLENECTKEQAEAFIKELDSRYNQ